MTTATDIGPDVQVTNADTGEVYPSEVQAEIDQREAGSLADILLMYRSWSDDLDEFRAELTAWRDEGLLDVHMPDGPEARRRRSVLAPLAQPKPNPYRELAPDNLDAEHEAAKKARQQRRSMGWVPNAPEGARATPILAAVELPEAEKAAMVAEVKAALGRIVADQPAPEVGASQPTPNATASELEQPGTVRESCWARLVSWFGGATTRRRQTEQDGGA